MKEALPAIAFVSLYTRWCVSDASDTLLEAVRGTQLATCDAAHPKFGGATEELQD